MRPLYNCVVQLGGSKDNQVRKELVSAAEIVVLKHIHGNNERGNPGVIGIEKTTKAVRRDDDMERAYLARRYHSSATFGEALVNRVFGIGTPLPVELSDDAVAEKPKRILEDEGEIVDMENLPVRRVGRPAKTEAAVPLEA